MSTLWTIILNLPTLIQLFTEIEKMILATKAEVNRKEFYKNMIAATEKARQTGDTSEIDKLFKSVASGSDS